MNAKNAPGSLAKVLIVLVLPSLLLGAVRQPIPVKIIDPVYPAEMSRSRIGGAVIAEFIIDSNGNVPRAQVLRSSDRRFEKAALEAVLRWEFKPGEKDGKKTNVRASQLIEFNLAAIPVYPQKLLIDRVEGAAEVEFSIGPLGRPTQIRLISASLPEFGYAAMAALETAAFGPPLDETASKNSPKRQTFTFSVEGKSDAPVDKGTRNYLDQLRQGIAFSPASTLSKPLVPIVQDEPNYPKGIPSDIRTGNAVVEFIVDAKGKVHLPRIVSSSMNEFGFSAAQAVANWTYKPIRLNAKNSGVLVTRSFVFAQPGDNHK